MTRALSLCCLAAFFVVLMPADTGVIVPSGHTAPDPQILSVDSLAVTILIDNGHATVSLKEVFANHTGDVLEGTYSLALPDDAAVSDFAIWDGLTRIPGVILERKRASEVYDQIRNQAIDPGLLQLSEISESNAPGEARHSTEFSVKVVPIPGFGYKRIEAAYRQSVPVAQRSSNFVFPLKSSVPLTVGHLSIHLELRSAWQLERFENVGGRYPLKVEQQTPNRILASLTQDNVKLTDDLQLRYTVANSDTPSVTAYRNQNDGEPGYFEAAVLLQAGAQSTASPKPRNVVVLFDTSLSMQWDKLERNFQSLEAVLRSLKPDDTFNVVVFNSSAALFAPSPQHATSDAVAKSLDWVRAGTLRGGTNLDAAFRTAFAQCHSDSYVVLLSDGQATEGAIASNKLAASVDHEWQQLASDRRPHLYALAIGDDANTRLMRHLAEHGGVFEQVNTTEPLEFKLNSFVHNIGATPLTPVDFSLAPLSGATAVYRLGQANYPGSRASWVGEYTQPGPFQFTVNSGLGAGLHRQTTSATLPANDTQHEYLPATWARARVDALLDKIDREGEDKQSIEEIIRLSRKYHFVTPYTSFLAAPRALLRPRLIRPGDPMLRVRTDPSITSVVALFPFGLNKPLRYITREDIWQTRFVAPPDLSDGSYAVRLLLRDRDGHVYQERKTFLISSRAPIVRATVTSPRAHPGSSVTLRVQASATTRTITAQLWGTTPLALHWEEAGKANTGQLEIPSTMPPGRYTIHVTAEDIAHNVSHQEVPLEVVP